MDIRFQNVRDNRHKGELATSTLEADFVRGDVEIVFNHDGAAETYRQSDVNVPLVIAEAKLFLDRLTRNGRATWMLGHTPFVDGRMEADRYVLFTGAPGDVEGGIVETLSQQQLDRAKNMVSSLQDEYGCLVPRADALRRD